jgi:DNA-directed RNA polymerase subunit RPC12/RpoP
MSYSCFAPHEIQEVNTLVIYSANEKITCTHCGSKIVRDELFSRSADKKGLVEGIRYTWCQICKPINS